MESSNTPSNQAVPPQPYFYMKPKKRRWWIPLVIIGSILLFILVVIIGFGALVGSIFNSEPIEVKENSVLYVHLDYDVSEYSMLGPLSFFTQSKQPSFFEVINSIEKAKYDDRIKGIYIKADNSKIGFAKLVELIQVIEDFKKTSHKFVYAYIEQGDEKDYMLTLAADKIFMPNEGMVTIDGFGASGLFFKGLLDKIGVDFYVCQFEDFKSAAEMYSRTGFSDSAKYALREYINQFYNTFAENVSKYRKIDRSTVDKAVNNGLYTTDSMMAYKFIDEAKVEPSIKEDMAKLAWGKEYNKDKKLRLVSINDYMMSEPYRKEDKYDYENQIAIVYGSGTILQQEEKQIFQSEKNINANQFVSNLKKAVNDKKVKAIIIRIDSPGGSVLASEIIWQAIVAAKKVKPVYASMSDVAASGGYYMAMACDTIIASPTTITGSIGVISAIPSLSGALKQLGISVDTVSTNRNSQFFNVYYPFPEKDKQKFYQLSKVIYDRFVSKVAQSRKMTFDEVRAIAKGRVWTGADAKRIGLVDTLGDLRSSIEIAKRRVGIPKNKKVLFKIYPKPDDDMMSFLSIFGKGNQEDEESINNRIMLSDISSKLGKSSSYLSEILAVMPEEFRNQFIYTMSLYQMAKTEKVLASMPIMIDVR